MSVHALAALPIMRIFPREILRQPGAGSIIGPFLLDPPNSSLEIPMKLLQTLVAVVVLFSGVAYAATEHDQALVERIKAVGQVCEAGGNCDAAAPAASGGGTKAAAARSGADIAAKNCAMCHGNPGIPGSPRTAAEWKPRVDAKGIDGLVASAMKGINAMPPKGMCMDCSDAEMKAAIQHLIK